MRAVLEAEETLEADEDAFFAAESAANIASDGISPEHESEPHSDDSLSQEPRAAVGRGDRRKKKKKKKRNLRGGGDDAGGDGAQSGAKGGGDDDGYSDPLAAELAALGLDGGAAAAARPPVETSNSSDRDEDGTELDEDEMLRQMMGAHISRQQGGTGGGDESDRSGSTATSDDDSTGEGAEGVTAPAEGSCEEASRADLGGQDDSNGQASGAEPSARGSDIPAADHSASAGRYSLKKKGGESGVFSSGVSETGSDHSGEVKSSPSKADRTQPGESAQMPGPEPIGYRAVYHAEAFEPDGKPMTKRQRRKQKGGGGAAEVPEKSCGVCGAEFVSRTQLFKHVAATGHALLKT